MNDIQTNNEKKYDLTTEGLYQYMKDTFKPTTKELKISSKIYSTNQTQLSFIDEEAINNFLVIEPEYNPITGTYFYVGDKGKEIVKYEDNGYEKLHNLEKITNISMIDFNKKVIFVPNHLLSYKIIIQQDSFDAPTKSTIAYINSTQELPYTQDNSYFENTTIVMNRSENFPKKEFFLSENNKFVNTTIKCKEGKAHYEIEVQDNCSFINCNFTNETFHIGTNVSFLNCNFDNCSFVNIKSPIFFTNCDFKNVKPLITRINPKHLEDITCFYFAFFSNMKYCNIESLEINLGSFSIEEHLVEDAEFETFKKVLQDMFQLKLEIKHVENEKLPQNMLVSFLNSLFNDSFVQGQNYINIEKVLIGDYFGNKENLRDCFENKWVIKTKEKKPIIYKNSTKKNELTEKIYNAMKIDNAEHYGFTEYGIKYVNERQKKASLNYLCQFLQENPKITFGLVNLLMANIKGIEVATLEEIANRITKYYDMYFVANTSGIFAPSKNTNINETNKLITHTKPPKNPKIKPTSK